MMWVDCLEYVVKLYGRCGEALCWVWVGCM